MKKFRRLLHLTPPSHTHTHTHNTHTHTHGRLVRQQQEDTQVLLYLCFTFTRTSTIFKRKMRFPSIPCTTIPILSQKRTTLPYFVGVAKTDRKGLYIHTQHNFKRTIFYNLSLFCFKTSSSFFNPHPSSR